MRLKTFPSFPTSRREDKVDVTTFHSAPPDEGRLLDRFWDGNEIVR